MANFDNCLQVILKNEGGYVNNPNDKGGETYKGISRKNWPLWGGWTAIDSLKNQPNFPASIGNNASVGAAVGQFYKSNFWDKMMLDNVTSDNPALVMFDCAVNMGVGTAVKFAQSALGVVADGVFGQQTLAAVNQCDPDKFKAVFSVQRIKRYVDIVGSNSSQGAFFFGWVRRAVEL